MLNTLQEINWKPSASDLRRFSRRSFRGTGLGLVVVAALSRFVWPDWARLQQLETLLAVSTLLGVLGIMHPVLARPLYWFVNGAAAGIAFVISNLALAGLYFLFLTPIAIIFRLRGRDYLALRRPERPGLWRDHKPPGNLRRYYRQF
ncbi:MAG: hypothetical protein EHM61_09455 [Acidobacteria bacterium]|nr:MAG: hypothetical protein EHM61_09455 [Acidobacteriota bacterium]